MLRHMLNTNTGVYTLHTMHTTMDIVYVRKCGCDAIDRKQAKKIIERKKYLKWKWIFWKCIPKSKGKSMLSARKVYLAGRVYQSLIASIVLWSKICSIGRIGRYVPTGFLSTHFQVFPINFLFHVAI